MIHNSMKETREVVEQLNSTSELLYTIKDQILDQMEGLSSIAEQNSASTEEATASIEEQAASVEEISANSENLAALAQDLQALMLKFKV